MGMPKNTARSEGTPNPVKIVGVSKSALTNIFVNTNRPDMKSPKPRVAVLLPTLVPR